MTVLDPARVFIDSSVLFAATFSEGGSARQLLFAGLRAERRLALSTLVLTETQRNIARKAPEKLPAFARLRPLLALLVSDPPTTSFGRLPPRSKPRTPRSSPEQ